MESAESTRAQTTSGGRRRGSQRDRPWDAPTAGRRPSAYAHYKKLVHDFDTLEEDLEQTRLAQEQYEAQLNQHKDKVEAIARQEREREHAAWMRERERQIEAICVHRTAVDALKQEHAALEEEEIRLQAELEVLHERQQQANESEAKKISDLVHKRSSILERELVKGQMDIEFLTQIVTTSKRKSTSETSAGEDALHALVGTIQQRRQDAFREAAAQFEARLHSFEAEKETLRKKAEEIEWKKQRALKILSTNQQQVIQGFFTTPRAAIQEANPPLPSLAFSEILDGIKQPSGDAVSRLQEFENVKHSARRQLDQVLAEAERNLEIGPQRLEQLDQRLKDRQQDALRLNLSISRSTEAARTGYDGRWGVETYRQDQYGLVYFMRGMVFEWMERAVDIARKQPERSLLEMEIQRHEATRMVMEQFDDKQRHVDCAALVARDIEHEVVQDIIRSIHRELMHSATRVRDIILQEIKQICFYPPQPAKTTPARPAPALRWDLFGAAWDELRFQHRHTEEPSIAAAHRQPRRLLMQPATASPASLTAAPIAVSSSPKKRFGLFAGGSKPKASEANGAKPSSSAAPTAARGQQPELVQPQTRVPVRVVSTDIPASTTVNEDGIQAQAVQVAEQTLWQSHISVVSKSFSSLATCSFVSCVQISGDGSLLALGTIDNELIVFSLLDDSETAAIAVRVVSVSKVIPLQGTSSSSMRRITRLCFSGCGRRLLAYDQFKVATLWSLVPPTTSVHSSDCFALEAEKVKPTALTLITQLDLQELMQEPSIPSEVLDADAPVAAARLQSAGPLTVSAFSFFSTMTITGDQPFVLVGASNGNVIKVLPTAKATPAKQDPATTQTLLGSGCEASFEWPRPQDGELRWLAKPSSHCSRELFRHAHRQSVLFVGSIPPPHIDSTSPDRNPDSLKARLVSVDQSGRVALWSYSNGQFTGFGWFVPQCVCQLDLSTPSSTRPPVTQPSPGIATNGDILQMQLTPDRKRLVVMVYFTGAGPLAEKSSAAGVSSAAPGGGNRLRFVQLDLSTNELTTVVPVRLEVEFTGDIPPRFVVLSMPTPKSAERRFVGTTIRPNKPSRSCFLVLLMNNALEVYSLTTGSRCMPPIPLHTAPSTHTKSRTKPKEPTLFNSITASNVSQPSDGGRTTTVAKIAVAGEQHKEIRIIHLNISTTS